MSAPRYSSKEMIERLVGFDTVSAKSNLALIEFTEDYLSQHDIPFRRTADSEGQKANLFATIGPDISGGVVLSGHTDVVPVEGQPWETDPFKVVEKNGFLYGRGTSDMKSFLAVALAMVPDFLAKPLKRPIHIAMSYDEETGCTGVLGMIEDIAKSLPQPRVVIVGEPTMMRLVTAHKTCSGFRTHVRGKAAHSSQPNRGANAIMAAAKLVSCLAEIAEEKRRNTKEGSGFEPPYTTLGVGMIEGGTALNIIAQDCSFHWEIRALPDDDEGEILERFERYARETVLPALKDVDPDAFITTEYAPSVPALRPEPEGDAETLVRRLTGLNEESVVSFGTEGGHFQNAGFSTVVFGPGSIDQAHQPNEFIALEQVEACETFLLKLRDWAAQA